MTFEPKQMTHYPQYVQLRIPFLRTGMQVLSEGGEAGGVVKSIERANPAEGEPEGKFWVELDTDENWPGRNPTWRGGDEDSILVLASQAPKEGVIPYSGSYFNA